MNYEVVSCALRLRSVLGLVGSQLLIGMKIAASVNMKIMLLFFFIPFLNFGQVEEESLPLSDSVIRILEGTAKHRIDSITRSNQVFDFGGPEPKFPGGDDALQQFIATNCQYPQEAIDQGIEGKVYVRFMIEKDGSLSEFEIVRSAHPILDAEALRLARSMPNWERMEYKGKPIRMRANIPITFVLTEEE